MKFQDKDDEADEGRDPLDGIGIIHLGGENDGEKEKK